MATPQQEQALEWVRIKRKRGLGSRFHNIAEGDFYDQLCERIEAPDLIDQQRTYTCGPATFIRGIAKKRPLLYAQFACKMFVFGEAAIGDFKIKATEEVLTVRNDSDAMLDMGAADWVVLASIRISKNFVLKDIGTMAGGATFAVNINYWFKQAGFKSVNKTNLLRPKSWENWEEACRRCRDDEMVCMWMNTNMFEHSSEFSASFPSARCADRSWYPDHWVGLIGVRSSRNPVDVDLFSWGQQGKLVFVQADETNFIRHHYGFVAADPLLHP